MPELYAILAALNFVLKALRNCGNSFTIFTDSQPYLKRIRSGIINSPLLDTLARLIEDLEDRGGRLTICYVPAHCDVPGNHIADTIAKEVAAGNIANTG